jgi:hypothetical protein
MQDFRFTLTIVIRFNNNLAEKIVVSRIQRENAVRDTTPDFCYAEADDESQVNNFTTSIILYGAVDDYKDFLGC